MGNLLGPWERLLATLQSLSPASLAIRGQVRRLIVNILNTASTFSLLTVASSATPYTLWKHTYFASPPKIGILVYKNHDQQAVWLTNILKTKIFPDKCTNFLGTPSSFRPIVPSYPMHLWAAAGARRLATHSVSAQFLINSWLCWSWSGRPLLYIYIALL